MAALPRGARRASARSSLVFEDLHWADDALLDFVDYLVDWASGVPLLVVCTARPSCSRGGPGWGGGKANARDAPRSRRSRTTRRRRSSHALLEPLRPRRPTCRRALLERAGGNPLYAEEFVRMLLERARRGRLACPRPCRASSPRASTRSRPRRRSSLQDAAVIGKVFWLGASAAANAGRSRSACTPSSARSSSAASAAARSPGEDEYAFRHALVRDVAYEQIPRADRAREAPARGRVDRVARAARGPRRDARPPLPAPRSSYARVSGEDDRASSQSRHAVRSARPATARSHSTPFRPPRALRRARRRALAADDPALSELLLRSRARATSASDERGDQALEEAREALLASGRSASLRPRRTHCSPSPLAPGATASIATVRGPRSWARRDLPHSPAKALV